MPYSCRVNWIEAIILGLVQGLTEFLPVSSSAHLRIVGEFLPGGGDPGAAFTAITQLGTETAVIIFFWRDIVRIITAWFRGLFNEHERNLDYRIGWYVIFATIPIGIIGFLLKDEIRTVARNLWITAIVLIVFSGVFWLAERVATQSRSIEQLTLRDGLVMGLAQCLALVPGVSRSGATIVGALLMGASKRAAAEFSFFLSMPTMAGAFAYDLYKNRDILDAAALGNVAVGFVCAFAAAIFVVKWLLNYVSRRGYGLFAWWRIIVGIVALVGLSIFR